MPIIKTTKGYKFGKSGHVFKTKKEAEAQMRAMYASGYRGKRK